MLGDRKMISVVIPVYNREKTIVNSVNNVLQQSYSDIEVIVVDDGSTDNTASLVKAIADTRVKYYYQENSGACVARNYGISKAKGELIAFQDSDDFWTKDKLEKQLSSLVLQGADIVFCQMSEAGKTFPKTIDEGFIHFSTFFKSCNVIGTQTLLGKKECFVEEQFDPSMPRLQDRELAIRLSSRYKIYFMKDSFVIKNTQADSISCNNAKGVEAIKIIMEKNRELLVSNPKLENYLLGDLVWYCVRENISCHQYFRMIIKNEASLKNILKYFLYLTGLLKIRYMQQGKCCKKI